MRAVFATLIALMLVLASVEAHADRAVAAVDSSDRAERVAALDRLWRTPDARALPALERLASRSFADVAEREEAWEQIAHVATTLAAESEIPAALETFLRTIATQKPAVRYLDTTTHERPKHRARYDFAKAAREAIASIERSGARRSLAAEVAGMPAEEAARRVAEAAWAEDPDAPRSRAARDLLPSFGEAGVQATLERIPSASADTQIWMVEFAEASFATDRARSTRALIQLAGSEHSIVWGGALGALMRLTPPGAAAQLVAVLEEQSDPARVRSGIGALGQLGDPAVLPFLRAQFRSSDPQTATSAARSLARVGPTGIAVLAGAAADAGPSQRPAILGLLEATDDPTARKTLEDLASRTRDPAVRDLIQQRMPR
jgi:hypothetical protein